MVEKLEEKKDKDTIELNEKSLINWNNISGKPEGKLINQIDENGIIREINANSIKSGIITGTKFQTSPSGARVIIGGIGEDINDIFLVDDTTGGTTPVTGNTASINFVRSDDSTQKFIIQKRAGKNDDDENVMEMFFDKAANDDQDNYIFIGKKGDVTLDETKTNIIQLEADGVINSLVSNGYDSSSGDGVSNIQISNTDIIPGLNDGGSRIVIQISQADTDNGYTDGGAIFFQIMDNHSSTSGITPLIIDKDGITIVSQDESEVGILGVDNSTGKLQWKGVDIS